MEKCHFSPFFIDYCSELKKIIQFLYDEGFRNIETDNFTIEFSKATINKKNQDWRTVIKEFLSENKSYANNIKVFIKSIKREFNLENLRNKYLMKLYMEIMNTLDDNDNYSVKIGNSDNVLLYTIKKKTNKA
ncbi:MAG: hypothetical protein K9W45_05095 [Candidatus Heimdallarchaeum aukensis]|uniref:Uncharacterized protein n=1 Tax=Candidatus Heimdallarchaeum aukensis TaxID=2876573 RepID=A0A9Y1BN83_9ARCH|nr:MAG: hypothetical protein K9W45_05095 [Candidatus Heimdallarchaeum aukensis]